MPTITSVLSTSTATTGVESYTVIADCTHLDLSKQVQYLDSGVGTAYSQYYLADGVEGQIMYFVAKSRANMHQIIINCDHIRYRNGSGVVVHGDWLPFWDNIATNGRTMGTGIFIDGAWSFDGGDID
jgi:hypothetical protein